MGSGLFHEGLRLVATVGGPMLGALLLVGLVVGVLQAATQINDPAIGFVPRAVTAVMVVWLLGGWMAERLAAFFTASVTGMR
jgi:flagellar biosynthesis protein FliQ